MKTLLFLDKILRSVQRLPRWIPAPSGETRLNRTLGKKVSFAFWLSGGRLL